MHSRRCWAASNPCDEVDLPEIEDNAEIHFFDPDEVDALIRAAEPATTASLTNSSTAPVSAPDCVTAS